MLSGSFGGINAWLDLEARRGHLEQHQENATRPGRAWATYKTTGVGSKVEEVVFPFESAFMPDYLPIFHFGPVLDPDGDDLPADDPPRCTAGVYDWRLNARGFYTGAFCWFVVDSYTMTNDLRLIWTLSWEGVASKDFLSSKSFPVSQLDL